MRPGRKKLFWIIPAAIAGIVLFAFLGGEVVKLLWNWLAPTLFGWRQINYWQALGLLALCRILFGGFGGHRGHGGGMRRRMRERMEERCANMTPEEREQFRERMRQRWGFGPSPSEGHGQ
jgi:hypothetical protein